MCEKSILEDPGTLQFFPNEYKTQEMCKRAVERISWMLQFLPDEYKP